MAIWWLSPLCLQMWWNCVTGLAIVVEQYASLSQSLYIATIQGIVCAYSMLVSRIKLSSNIPKMHINWICLYWLLLLMAFLFYQLSSGFHIRDKKIGFKNCRNPEFCTALSKNVNPMMNNNVLFKGCSRGVLCIWFSISWSDSVKQYERLLICLDVCVLQSIFIDNNNRQ